MFCSALRSDTTPETFPFPPYSFSRDRIPMRWIFSNLPNPSGHTVALGSTQPLTEMSTRNLKKKPGGKVRPARRADNLAAIC
jgi:hypothetical protein